MIDLILLVLATYSISVVVTTEHGAFAIFTRFRNYLDKDAEPQPLPPSQTAPIEAWENYNDYIEEWQIDQLSTMRGTLSAIFNCPVCLGLYVSFSLNLFYWLADPYFFIYWPAVYGGHIFLWKISKD